MGDAMGEVGQHKRIPALLGEVGWAGVLFPLAKRFPRGPSTLKGKHWLCFTPTWLVFCFS